MFIIYLLSFLAKFAFLGLTAYALVKHVLDEREFYNDWLDLIGEGKFHALLDVAGWTQTEFNVGRGLLELLFVLLVLLPGLLSWPGEGLVVLAYLGGTFAIYRLNNSRSLNRNQVFYLGVLRLVAIIALFLA